MYILAHRGISDHCKAVESTREAFEFHLKQNRGIEFDIAFTNDFIPVVWHDRTLKRLSNGKDCRCIKDVRHEEIRDYVKDIMTLQEMFTLLLSFDGSISAFHIKGDVQDVKSLDLISEMIQDFGAPLLRKMIVFDLRFEPARILKTRIPEISLYASVAHDYDVNRYNDAVHGTLFTMKGFDNSGELFDGAWLDEWDRNDAQGNSKTFYNEATFSLLKKSNKKIAIVTPELHASSPGLLASEAHQDGQNREVLLRRCMQIAELRPDFVCTDISEALQSPS